LFVRDESGKIGFSKREKGHNGVKSIQGTMMGSISRLKRASNDRRESSRFPMKEDLRYRLLNAKSPTKTFGTGVTLNIGSGGILFTTEELLPVGRSVELSVNWPARLDGTCPLKFVATGRIVRAEEGCAAVRIERYQFKTRGAGSLSFAVVAQAC